MWVWAGEACCECVRMDVVWVCGRARYAVDLYSMDVVGCGQVAREGEGVGSISLRCGAFRHLDLEAPVAKLFFSTAEDSHFTEELGMMGRVK